LQMLHVTNLEQFLAPAERSRPQLVTANQEAIA
jgi:hypothetical protein